MALLIGLIALALGSPCFARDYQIGAGDTISIQVFDEPRLSGVTLVPSSCRVDVELIGPIEICGRTTGEVQKDVQDRFAAGYLIDPHVIVEVTIYGSQRIEVRGAVKTPGIQVLTGATTLSQAITAAGGPMGDNVVDVDVVDQNGKSTTYSLSKVSLEPEPVLLQAGDTVILRQGRHVYVDGEVKTEGQVAYHEGLTVSQAVSLAGGPSQYASLRRVFILTASGKRIVVNLNRVRLGRDQDVLLGPDDRITLPRSFF